MMAFRQVISEELRPLCQEIKDLHNVLDETRVALHKLSLLNAAILQTNGSDNAIVPQNTAPAAKPEPVSERISRAHVIERMLATTRKLQESGRDIDQMTAASLAREAGVKPAQFTYAFKNRETFMQHYTKWVSEQQIA
jgi:hypothetical protein